MTMTIPGRFTTTAVALAVAASTTLAVAPARAAPTPTPQFATIAETATGAGSVSGAGGSLDQPVVQGVFLIGGALLVSVGLAVAAGVRGGAFPLPVIPGVNA